MVTVPGIFQLLFFSLVQTSHYLVLMVMAAVTRVSCQVEELEQKLFVPPSALITVLSLQVLFQVMDSPWILMGPFHG